MEQRLELPEHRLDEDLDVDGRERRRLVGLHAHGRQDRVDEPVEPLDLLDRAEVPCLALLAPLRVAQFAAVERGLVREQVRVGADDRERRPELVRDQRDELIPGTVQGLELLDLRLGLSLQAALLDDAREEVGDGRELVDVVGVEVARLLRLGIEHADHLVVPGQRHGEHRRDEPPLVDAADPQEARVGADVRDDRSASGSGRRAR